MPLPDILARSWQRAWQTLGAVPGAGLFDRLLAAYSEAHRHYHTLQHLRECLVQLEPALALAERPAEVTLALWFHDAVYALQAHDNEARSALWAAEALQAAGVGLEVRQRVEALIGATAHAALPATPDARLVVDVDLSILGAEPARFAEYEGQIRAEYDWVPQALFSQRRRAVLRSFLEREPMYNTDHFRQRLEARARRNLLAALA